MPLHTAAKRAKKKSVKAPAKKTSMASTLRKRSNKKLNK